MVPANKLRYDLGLIINKNKKINLTTRKVDDGKYAIFEVKHIKHDVLSFWKNIQILTADLLVDDKIASHLYEFYIPIIL